MGKHWKDVKAEIEAENDRIWFDEPEYITMSKTWSLPRPVQKCAACHLPKL